MSVVWMEGFRVQGLGLDDDPIHGVGIRLRITNASQHQCTLTVTTPPCYSLKMYNNLVERCFKECVEDMRSKALTPGEEKVT